MDTVALRRFQACPFVVALPPGVKVDIAGSLDRWMLAGRERYPRIVRSMFDLIRVHDGREEPPDTEEMPLARASIEPVDPGELPLAAPSVLPWFGAGPEEIERVNGAPGVSVVVAFPHIVMSPAWSIARAIARGISAEVDGVVIDAALRCPEPLASRDEVVPVQFRPYRDVTVLLACEPSGCFALCSYGLEHWRVPDLAFREIVPGTEAIATRLLRVVALKIVAHVESSTTGGNLFEDPGDLPMSFSIRPADWKLAGRVPDESRLNRPAADDADDEDQNEAEDEADQDEAKEEEVDQDEREDAVADTPDHPGVDVPLRLVKQGGRSVLEIGPDPRPPTWLHDVHEALAGPPRPTIATAPYDREAHEAAVQRAIAELPSVRRRFREGLRGGTLAVKLAIETRTGPELMWATVLRWDDAIEAVLANHAARDPAVRAGMPIIARTEDVRDWLIRDNDGVEEGGYTNQVLRDGITH